MTEQSKDPIRCSLMRWCGSTPQVDNKPVFRRFHRKEQPKELQWIIYQPVIDA